MALRINPNCAEAYERLGATLAARGQIDEAIASYQKALEIKPNDAEAHNNLATLAGRKQIVEAIAHYRKSLEIKPDYAEAHNNLGMALMDRGQIDEAVTHYQKALEIKPDSAKAHNNLARRWPPAANAIRRSAIFGRHWKFNHSTTARVAILILPCLARNATGR